MAGMETFAGPDARELDLDVAAGLQSAQPDDSFGKINNLYRLAHIEHIDRHTAVFEPVAGRRDHEIAGLTDRHEIAHHVRMGDGHGTAEGAPTHLVDRGEPAHALRDMLRG